MESAPTVTSATCFTEQALELAVGNGLDLRIARPEILEEQYAQ